MCGAEATLIRAWLTVALLWFVGCLNYLDRVMIATMRQSLVDAIPMTDAQFGRLTTIFLLVYAVLSPVAGYLADRFNRSHVIIGSLFVWSLITWLTAHATTYGQLLVTRALMGVSEACYIPAALALIADYHGPRTRSLANGTHLSGVLGAVCGRARQQPSLPRAAARAVASGYKSPRMCSLCPWSHRRVPSVRASGRRYLRRWRRAGMRRSRPPRRRWCGRSGSLNRARSFYRTNQRKAWWPLLRLNFSVYGSTSNRATNPSLRARSQPKSHSLLR